MFESNTKEILKHLEKLTRRGHSHYRVFEDWLDLALYAFMGNDEEYMKIVGRYNNSYEAGNRDIDHFANALAELMLQMSKTNEELLGEIYMQWNNPESVAYILLDNLTAVCIPACQALVGKILTLFGFYEHIRAY